MPNFNTSLINIPFDQLSERMQELPAEAKPAALLVVQWLEGQQEFSIFTSGSTGRPKPQMLARNKIEYSAQLTGRAFGLEEGDTLFCCLNTDYIAGLIMVFRATVLGCNLYVAPTTALPLEDVPEGTKLDFASFVALQMQSLLESGEPRYLRMLNGMKAILVGGGPVSPKQLELIQRVEAPVFHTYGMTETYTHIAIRRLNGPEKSEYYYPLPEVQLNQDTRGCLVIQSPVTDDLPLVTNDVVEFNDNGGFRWQGRADNVVNSGGVKIQLEKVESALLAYTPFVELLAGRRFILAGLADDKLGEKLVLVLEKPAEGESADAFIDILKAMTEAGMLTAYTRPREVIFVPEIKLTRTGKVDRRGTVKQIIQLREV